MIRSVEFDLETKSETNQREPWQSRHQRRAEQRKATREALWRIGAHVPSMHVERASVMAPNKIVVKLVRIAPAQLDDDNLRGAMKAPRDEVAAWIGVDDRDPIITWEYGQEQPAHEMYGDARQHVRRVRVEIADLAPGEPRVIVCASNTEHRETGARVRRAIRAEEKRRAGGVVQTGRVLSYQPDAAARGASSAARAKADAAFAKVTGKPTVNDLRQAAEKALGRSGTYKLGAAHDAANYPNGRSPDPGEAPLHTSRAEAQRECDRANGHALAKTIGVPIVAVVDAAGVERIRAFGKAPPKGYTPPRDPGDEAPARDLADCETCGVRVTVPCVRQGVEPMVNGVHIARAKAAGIHVVGKTVSLDMTPWLKPLADRTVQRDAEATARATRRLATVPGQARLALWRSWAALPWEQTPCPACGGDGVAPASLVQPVRPCPTCKGRGRKGIRLVHLARFDGTAEPPATVTHPVPTEHQAAHGLEMTLHRRTFKSSSTGSCWLYDTTTTPTKGD